MKKVSKGILNNQYAGTRQFLPKEKEMLSK